MVDKLGIAGQQTHALVLGLHKQQLVERALMPKWLRKFGGGMTGREWWQFPIDYISERHHGG